MQAHFHSIAGVFWKILKEENFPHATIIEGKASTSNEQSISDSKNANDYSYNRNNNCNNASDIEASLTTERIATKGGEEDTMYILIPEPGLPSGAWLEFMTNNSQSYYGNRQSKALRQVPNECSICLCEYTVGSDIVWSSNPQCEHVFHETCIEQWLMKHRDGPLCPCCRRDFVIDPFDFGDDVDAVGELVSTDSATIDGIIEGNSNMQAIDSDVAMSEQTNRNTNEHSPQEQDQRYSSS